MAKNIWISPEEIKALPMTGAAWTSVKAAADKTWSTPDLSNQDDPTNCYVLAGAIVYCRTGIESYRTKVVDAVLKIPETENGGRTLALGRELACYVIAADLVGLPADKIDGFKAWLSKVRTETLDSKTLISTHDVRPNNWGTECGFSRMVAALFLDDMVDFAKAVKLFKGWLGDRSSYAGFTYGDLAWQSNRNAPVGINPKGALIDGHDVDGVLPEEMRRSGGFVWPPPKENYVYTGLAGAWCMAVVCERFGQPVWNVCDQALLRAMKWLYNVCKFPPTGNDTWQAWAANYGYGANTFPATSPCDISREIAWFDYTHVKKSAPTPVLPVADFSATPLNGVVPLAVAFKDLSTGNPTEWRWNFGNGITSNVQNPAHTYSAPGNYTVTLTVTNSVGENTKAKAGLIVATQAPTETCYKTAGSWINVPFVSKTGVFTVSYNMTPTAIGIDCVTGVSNGAATGYSKLAAITRFNKSGYIDARNAGAYGSNMALKYEVGVKHYFRLVIDITKHTYSVYVRIGSQTAPEQLLATNFAFRTEQATVAALSNVAMYNESGSHTTCSISVI